MSRLWPIFVTAANITIQQLNRAIIEFDDIQFGRPNHGGGFDDTSWTLLTSTTFNDTHPAAVQPVHAPVPSSLVAQNQFTNASTADITRFVLDCQDALGKRQVVTDTWLVLDDEGVRNQTAVFGHRELLETQDARGHLSPEELAYDPALTSVSPQPYWMRVPWKLVENVWANLFIGNMGFSEWYGKCEENRWCEFEHWHFDPYEESEKARKIERERLAKEGHIEL